jgi:hypothetical protein
MNVDRIGATSVATVVVLLLALGPSSVRADGGFFIDTTATTTQSEAASEGLLSSSGQRAVLWQSSVQCWDLYVEPGTVELANAAWVMPLPVVPEISEASADFIDQLDAATTPVFSTTREYLRVTEGGDGGGCGCAGGDSAGGAAPGEQLTGSEAPAVRVWGQGHLGDLAYEVVSTEEATALQAWLTDHDYVVPDTLADSVAPYVSDGYYFFVAQVAREADAATAVSVIRFHLCDETSLFYPLRLSAYSVAESLDFTLWFVDPNAYVAPTNCSWEAPGEFYEQYTTFYDESDYEQHREELDRPFAELYAARIDEILQTESGRSLAVQYAGQIDAGDLAMRLGLLADSGVSPPLGSDRGGWSSELASIIDDGLVVTRLVGAFPAAAMDEDLWFRPTVTMEQDLAIYSRWIELWNMEPAADAGGALGRRGGHPRGGSGPSATRRGPAGSPWHLTLIAVVGVFSLRRRHRGGASHL